MRAAGRFVVEASGHITTRDYFGGLTMLKPGQVDAVQEVEGAPQTGKFMGIGEFVPCDTDES